MKNQDLVVVEVVYGDIKAKYSKSAPGERRYPCFIKI